MASGGRYTKGPFEIRWNLSDRPGLHIDGHEHNFDHLTVVFSGSIRVRFTYRNGYSFEKTYHAGSEVLIRADVCHKIWALEPHTLTKCLFAHRDPITGKPVPEYNGNELAYV